MALTRSLVRLCLTALATAAVCAVPATASAHGVSPGKACLAEKAGKAGKKNPHCAPCPAATAHGKKPKKQHCAKHQAGGGAQARASKPQRTRTGPSDNASSNAQPGWSQPAPTTETTCSTTTKVVSAPSTVYVSPEPGDATGTRYGIVVDSCAYAQPGAISQVTVTNPRTGTTMNYYDTVMILDADTIDAGFYVSQSLGAIPGDTLEVRLYDSGWSEILIHVTMVG